MRLNNLLKLHGSFTRSTQRACYSRKSSSKFTGTYKIVNRDADTKEDVSKNSNLNLTNWELTAPKGFRFYLPGNVGPAFFDEVPVSFVPTNGNLQGAELECDAQDCPILLRQGITELFPGFDTFSTQLTIISLTQKKMKKANEHEVEILTKQFMWGAQAICNQLCKAGYWADFINPFSGLPFCSGYNPTELYKTDERFRCLGFQISDTGPCRVISNKGSNKFIGNLFTTAPPSTSLLKEILRDCEF